MLTAVWGSVCERVSARAHAQASAHISTLCQCTSSAGIVASVLTWQSKWLRFVLYCNLFTMIAYNDYKLYLMITICITMSMFQYSWFATTGQEVFTSLKRCSQQCCSTLDLQPLHLYCWRTSHHTPDCHCWKMSMRLFFLPKKNEKKRTHQTYTAGECRWGYFCYCGQGRLEM